MKILLLFAVFSNFARAAEPSSMQTVSYLVPTEAALAPFARFDVPYSVSEGPDGATVLTYSLPAVLLGHTRTFQLSGQVDSSGAPFSLHGAGADMSCIPDAAGAAVCRVVQHGIQVDLGAVQTALVSAALSPAELAGKLELATFVAREGGDLVGTMSYPGGLHYR